MSFQFLATIYFQAMIRRLNLPTCSWLLGVAVGTGLAGLPLAGAAGQTTEPIARWTFDDPAQHFALDASNQVPGPRPPRFPGFDPSNLAIDVAGNQYQQFADPEGKFLFENGDTITAEAWVNLNSIQENAYIIGKGRSTRGGPGSLNQNWAFRLRKQNGSACLNFLFRCRGGDDEKADWHRWTSVGGFAPGSGWHHVAIQYEFGKPDSIRGILDGELQKGKWDMGGPTTNPPVSDNEDVWIGSAMGGLPSNSLDGHIDDLTIYRHAVDQDQLISRYQYVPRPITKPAIPDDAVVMEMFGPHGQFNKFPEETDLARVSWTLPAMALTRIPHHYDAHGVIADWTVPGRGTMLVRGWSKIQLEPGKYQFLIRSRGLSRLFIDGKQIANTPAQRNRSGAHHVVDPLPEVPVSGMRPHYMNDHERIVEFESTGKAHEIRFEFNVGSEKFSLRLGETCVAIARTNEMFRLLSPGMDIPLTDAGWEHFLSLHDRQLDELNRQRRVSQAESQTEYWNRRHALARKTLIRDRVDAPQSIDATINHRIDDHNRRAIENAALDERDQFYREHVQPLLQNRCVRCHGNKRNGDLDIRDRDNLLAGGESGSPAVVPGNARKSQLFSMVAGLEAGQQMPPEGPGLHPSELQILETWIQQGAVMPTDAAAVVELTPPVDDYRFLRRIFIDTVGVVPTLGEIDEFFADPEETRRLQVIDRLLDDPRWADNWVGYWQDVFAENPNLLKPTLNNTGPFRYWIYESLVDNKPLDQFATDLIMMRGSKWYGGAAGFEVASENDVPMAAKAHVIGTAFLGIELKCARCHDAPYHDWKQQDLFQMAAMLGRQPIELPDSSTVPIAFFESQTHQPLITASLKPGTTVPPRWPFAQLESAVRPKLEIDESADTRAQLAFEVTSSRRFAEVMANRIWKRLMGAGIVEPVHDWSLAEPSDPALLRVLSDELIRADFDQKQFARKIFLSEAYQRSAMDRDSDRFFQGPVRRRMTAEQIVDSALVATGQPLQTEMLTLDLEGTHKADWFFNFGFPRRAWEFTTLANERDRPSLALPRAQAVTDVLKAFGWRNSRPEPLSQRAVDPNLVQPGALANGTFGTWLTRLSDHDGMTGVMLAADRVETLVDQVYLQMLTRMPTSEERRQFVQLLTPGFETRRTGRTTWSSATDIKRFPYTSWSNHLNVEANRIRIEMERLAREGDPPTQLLDEDWRKRAEDMIWALLNNPEMIIIP